VSDPLAEGHCDFTPYHYTFNNPIRFIDPLGLDTFDINILDQSINQIAVENSENHVYRLYGEDNELLNTYTLEINDDNLVEFPSSGDGFNRYGDEDEGGDHYLKPKTAAALFGLVTELHQDDNDFRVDIGDLSDSQGGAPGGDHQTHGGPRGYSGECVDYRYLDGNNQSYQGYATDRRFNLFNNTVFVGTAKAWGFEVNYSSDIMLPINLRINIDGATPRADHRNHGHLTYTGN